MDANQLNNQKNKHNKNKSAAHLIEIETKSTFREILLWPTIIRLVVLLILYIILKNKDLLSLML